MDPIFTSTAALSLAVIFATTATHKLRAPAWFRRQVAEYRLLPAALVTPVALGLSLLEAGLAAGLLWAGSRSMAALGALILISLYAGGIAINLWRGRHDMDCGCSGPGAQQPLHSRLLLRNLILGGLALLAAFPVDVRPLGLFDDFVIIAAPAVIILLYAATDVWLANRPLLLNLSGR